MTRQMSRNVGVCPSCRLPYGLRSDGLIRVHGPGENHCPGSRGLPLAPEDAVLVHGSANTYSRCRCRCSDCRTWTTAYRGPLLLHAAQSWVPGGIDYADTVSVMSGWQGGQGMPRRNAEHPTGIVGVADVVGVCSGAVDDESWPTRCGCGLWAMANQCHWRLGNVRPLAAPVPCRGALGLWTPPADVLAAVEAQYADIEVAW